MLDTVQPAGKGAMRAADWWRGLRDSDPGGRIMSRTIAARRVAYETLRAVHESDAYANLLLPTAISRAGLATPDAALATELTYGTLRRQGTYDAVIAIAADRPVADIDPAVLDALRLGVHQLLSTRVASHAAVNESVELARGAGGRGAAGFANAVLRRVARDTPGDWMTHVAESARSDDEQLGLLFSHPVWVVRAFRRALAAEGRAEELEALLTADNASPRVTMAALPDLADVPDDARRTPFSPIGFRLGGGDPDSVVRGSGGRIRVQDEGSQLAALALTRALPDRAGGAVARPVRRARAARPPCSRPRRSRTARRSRRTRSHRRAPGSCARRSPACRWTCRCPRRTAGSRAQDAPEHLRPHPGRRALHRASVRSAAGRKRAGARRPATFPRSHSCSASCSPTR